MLYKKIKNNYQTFFKKYQIKFMKFNKIIFN